MNSNSNNNSNPPKDNQKAEHTLFLGSKKALIGGVLAGAIALGGQWLVGQVISGWEAKKLLESVISSALYFGGSSVTASATILALMLTMLGLTKQSNDDFGAVFFKRIERIGLLSTIVLIASVLLLLFLSIPLQESDDVPGSWYQIIYYVLTTFIAVLAGLVVSIVLMLFNAISSLIDVVRPTMDEEVDEAKDREEDESNQEKEQIDDSVNSEDGKSKESSDS